MSAEKSHGLTIFFVLVGSSVLFALSCFLLSKAVFDCFGLSMLAAVPMTLVLAGLVYGSVTEFRSACKLDSHSCRLCGGDALVLLSIVAGTLVTFALSTLLELGPVVASALVGILAALLLPKFAVPIFCGSFAGMVAPELADTYVKVLVAGTIAGVVYVVTKAVFNGFGGKLGTIAFTGCVATIFFSGRGFVSAPVPSGELAFTIIVWTLIGTVATYIISVRFKHGPVMASGVVGLMGGLLFPAIYPAIAPTLAAAFYSASFAGMSSNARFKNEAPVVLLGIVVGAVFVLTMPYLGGAGGKLGTIAFISSISVTGSLSLIRAIQKYTLHVPAQTARLAWLRRQV